MSHLKMKIYVPKRYCDAWEASGRDINDLPEDIRRRLREMWNVELKVLAGMKEPDKQVVVPELSVPESAVTPVVPEPVVAPPKPDPPPKPAPVLKARSQGRLGMDPKYRKEICVHRVSPASFCKICDSGR